MSVVIEKAEGRWSWRTDEQDTWMVLCVGLALVAMSFVIGFTAYHMKALDHPVLRQTEVRQQVQHTEVVPGG